MAPVHIYIHIPFCRKRCSYCDFTSYTGSEDRIEAYVQGVCLELGMVSAPPVVTPTLRSSIFLGGGTPSLLSLDQVERILHAASSLVPLQEAEITMEVNPGTLIGPLHHPMDGESYFRGLRDLGVNRLSLGVQSVDDHVLRILGRIHSAAEAEACVASASRAGFTHLNLDLIFGVPGQSLESWRAQLRTVLQWATWWGVNHLSCYALVLEKHTPLYLQVVRGEVALPDEDDVAAMYEDTIEYLANAGYLQYEISNWARQPTAHNQEAWQTVDHRCHHHLAYWLNDDYLGIGAGAHGYVSPQRYANLLAIDDYLAAVQAGKRPIAITTPLTLANRCAETMFMGLRLTSGVSSKHFRERCGVELEQVYGATITALQQEGLLEWNGDAVALTPRGRMLGNLVFERFLGVPSNLNHHRS